MNLNAKAQRCEGAKGVVIGFTLLCAFAAYAEEKINYQQHILPLIEANCSKCHNGDKKKADLDLTSYQGALQGSGSGPVVISGNPDGSKLWKAITHAEEPNIDRKSTRLNSSHQIISYAV